MKKKPKEIVLDPEVKEIADEHAKLLDSPLNGYCHCEVCNSGRSAGYMAEAPGWRSHKRKPRLRLKKGDRVRLIAFEDQPEEDATVIDIHVKPSGEVILGVEVDFPAYVSDDCIREIGLEQIKEKL